MPRKHANRPRPKGNHRSGGHRAGGQPRPAPRGFTGPGYRQLYGWMMPGLAGEEKRHFFNEVSGGVVLAAGVVGAGLGYGLLGWLGGALGLAAGISAGGSYVEKQRYYRP